MGQDLRNASGKCLLFVQQLVLLKSWGTRQVNIVRDIVRTYESNETDPYNYGQIEKVKQLN